jgi:hypothetical protein
VVSSADSGYPATRQADMPIPAAQTTFPAVVVPPEINAWMLVLLGS